MAVGQKMKDWKFMWTNGDILPQELIEILVKVPEQIPEEEESPDL